jgi:hypothetical protein
VLTHPDDLVALARSRQEEALSRAARRRLATLAAAAPGGVATAGLPGARLPGGTLLSPLRAALGGLRRGFGRLGPLVRRVALVPLLIAAATALSGLLTAA